MAKLRFRWLTTSPESHNVTMRNQLEPLDVVIEIDVPNNEEYFVNFMKLSEHRELEIKSELLPDVDSAGDPPQAILTVEGMRYVMSQLSGTNDLEPEVEDEEDWEDDLSEDDFSDEDDNFDEDDDFEDFDEDDWEDE